MRLLVIFTLIYGLAVVSDLYSQKNTRPKFQCEDNFKSYDTDKDGKLSFNEFKAIEHRQQNIKGVFESRDTDKDGFLSLEEFCTQGSKGQGKGRNVK